MIIISSKLVSERKEGAAKAKGRCFELGIERENVLLLQVILT
jgi:hypothetical protein